MVTIESVDELERMLKVLSNPIRLKIIASLQGQPNHAYALAKQLGLSYPLAHLYLESLERAGLIEGSRVLSIEDERERILYRLKDFRVELTPEFISKLVNSGGHN